MDIATIVADLLDADDHISDVGRDEIEDGILYVRTSEDELYTLTFADM